MTHPNGPYREGIVTLAREWIGTPYVHQARTKHSGTDCLGLVLGIWETLYGSIPENAPPYTPDWSERAGDETLLRAARLYLSENETGIRMSGDVILFRMVHDGPVKHMGILSAPDKFIHAYAGHEVSESWLGRWWAQRCVGTYAFPGIVS